MPIMDSLAATRDIRALERERAMASTSIVALTADAGVHDIERSTHAGCNAHSSKPISKTALLSAIEKYRRQSVEMVSNDAIDANQRRPINRK